MAKKRGKVQSKHSSKKPVKKAKVSVKAPIVKEDPSLPKVPLKDALKELEILADDKKTERKEDNIEKKETEIEEKEESIMKEEKKIERETKNVEKLEHEIKKEVSAKPLTHLSIRDVNKGIIGAFIGVVAHFAFLYGKEIAKNISITRATLLIIISYILILVLMYETGYREIRERKLAGALPLRATVIFLTSIAVILVIFFLFNQVSVGDITGLYKQIAVTSVLASLGAGTADLIGRD